MSPTVAELKAEACRDCVPDVTVQGGAGLAGAVLVVVVRHAPSCPWAARCVPTGGATIVQPNALLRHVREGEPDALEADAP